MSDAQVAQPEVEVKQFSEAEKRSLDKLMKPYREAATAVNQFLDFLKEQHSISDNEGWQLGDGCFARRVPVAKVDAPAAPAPTANNRTQERERRVKKQVAAPVKAKKVSPAPLETVHPNGVPVGDVAL